MSDSSEIFMNYGNSLSKLQTQVGFEVLSGESQSTCPFLVRKAFIDEILKLFAILKPVPYDCVALFDFKRNWISVPQRMPTDNLGIDPSTIVNKLEREEVYSLVSDVNLSPSLESTEAITPHTVQVAWSHRGMLYYGRCILALLTNMGLVTFHVLINGQWIIAFDLSEAFMKHFKDIWKDDPNLLCDMNAHDQLCHLRKRVNQVRTSAIGWSPLFRDKGSCYSYFFTGQANGDIVIWKMPSMMGDTIQGDPKIILKFNTNVKRMTCINWFSLHDNKGIIVVGEHRGVIKLFDLTLDNEDSHKLELKHLVDIWPESDNISVKRVDCLGEGPNLSNRCITAIKGNFLVVMSVGNDGTLVDRCSLHMGNFNIVGFVPLEKFSFILNTQRGNMTKITLSISNNGKINHDVQELKSYIDMSEKLSFGLSASSNKMIWLMLNSIYKPYDHLVLREPTIVVVFTLNFLPNPLNVLRSNPCKLLTTYWDCLEMYRVLQLRGKDFKIEVQMENLYSRTTYDLCCSLWILSIYSKFKSLGNESQPDMETNIKKLEDALFLQHSKKVLQRLISSDLKSLTDIQLQSFSLFYKWTKKFVDEIKKEKLLISDSILSVLNAVEKKDSFLSSLSEETCGLCGENVEMKNWKNCECDAILPDKAEDSKVKGHCIPRCSLSLIQCLTLPYRICFICSALAIEQLVHEDVPICILCNGTLNLDDRVIH